MAKRVKWLNRRCMACHALFETSRSDARLCSPRCRQRWRRLSQEQQSALIWADSAFYFEQELTPEELDRLARETWPGGPRLSD